MVKFKLGTEAIYSEDTGNLILGDLLHTLFAVFLFAGLFLPLLMDFGLLDFFGTLMTKIMRPLFKLPGRRSEEHMSELQSRGHLVCRLLLEKKKSNH